VLARAAGYMILYDINGAGCIQKEIVSSSGEYRNRLWVAR
jgi:hypothetical protein